MKERLAELKEQRAILTQRMQEAVMTVAQLNRERHELDEEIGSIINAKEKEDN